MPKGDPAGYLPRVKQARKSKKVKSPYPERAKTIVDRNPFAGANAAGEIRNGGTMRAEDSPSKFNPKNYTSRKRRGR